MTLTIDLPDLTVPVAKLNKIEIEKRFLEEAEMHNLRKGSNKRIDGHKKKVEYEFLPQKMNLARYPSPPADISDGKKNESEGV